MIKSFTDLEQSRKLVEILPLESADMIYIMYRNGEKPQNGDENLSTVYESNEHKWYWIDIIDEAWNMRIGEDIPCWSLATLLSVIKEQGLVDLRFLQSTFDNRGNHLTNVWCCTFENLDTVTLDLYAVNPVDACYEMILKLNELKML